MRIHGAIYAALDTQRNENGHLFLDSEELLKAAFRLLNDRIPQPQLRVKPEEIAQVLENMVLNGEVVRNKGRIYQIS